MYNISCNKNYSNKLEISSLKKRLIDLNKSTKRNVIYLKDTFDSSTFRYRTYNVMQAMRESGQYHVTCFLIDELTCLAKYVDKINLVILQRCKWSFDLENYIHLFKSKKINVIFDMDDLIYDPKYVPEYLNNCGYFTENYMNIHFAMAVRFQIAAKMCDAFFVTTERLKERMEEDFQKKAFVHPNFLNREQEEIANEILQYKEEKKDSKKFVIGYFSGSNSHARDLEIVESALVQLISKYDNIYLQIVGYMNLSSELQRLKDDGKIIISPFVTYQELEYLIASVDINIIPLQKNVFNECKSELKYFEASIVNTITVACNNEVYSNLIQDGVNGFLASELEWFEKLEYIYLNYENLKDIIKKAREYCLEKYGCFNQKKLLEKIYDKMIEM